MRLIKKLATLAIFLQIAAARREIFQPGNVSFGDLLIHFLGEEQRDVDVDSFADQLPDCGKPLRPCRAP